MSIALSVQRDQTRRPALVVAHPGHELRLFGWLAAHRPTVHILTGATRVGPERIEASAALVAEVGATKGRLFGGVPDRDVYAMVLAGDPGPFHEWTDRLRDAFVADDPSLVVVDAWQLYNVCHDLVHVMARVAAAEASRRLGRTLAVHDYPVVVDAVAGPAPSGPLVGGLRLDAGELARKMAAARAFPDVACELAEIVAHEGEDALARETLRSTLPLDQLVPAPGVKPAYEWYGEQRVAAGLYREVLRWSHVAPIVASLRDRAAV